LGHHLAAVNRPLTVCRRPIRPWRHAFLAKPEPVELLSVKTVRCPATPIAHLLPVPHLCVGCFDGECRPLSHVEADWRCDMRQKEPESDSPRQQRQKCVSLHRHYSSSAGEGRSPTIASGHGSTSKTTSLPMLHPLPIYAAPSPNGGARSRCVFDKGQCARARPRVA